MRILFLCTGNYYRSRFAELQFNALASAAGIAARASSGGLSKRLSDLGNVGPISPHVVRSLKQNGTLKPEAPEQVRALSRMPRMVTGRDFVLSDRIIAVCRREHEPMIQALFPEEAARMEYWEVDDSDELDPELALATLANHVRSLVDELVRPRQA